eukprot:TRINITY_DN3847_c0_g1_i3.p1 TRINITY_DN3847_c0_g1~~TRINITY_DN3847_c0_g1_i3.p1  ORF type:complete len:356 (+),score=127.83 TRINITY_DN3847_c0_g1_i3:90-1157(+)
MISLFQLVETFLMPNGGINNNDDGGVVVVELEEEHPDDEISMFYEQSRNLSGMAKDMLYQGSVNSVERIPFYESVLDRYEFIYERKDNETDIQYASKLMALILYGKENQKNCIYDTETKIDGLYAGKIKKMFEIGPKKKKIDSAYDKKPIDSAILTKLGFSVDEHGFETHGGNDRAINHYNALNYDVLKKEFPNAEISLKPAGFGENISTSHEDFSEEVVCVGDIYQIGESILVQVSQPRYPCPKVKMFHNANGLTLRVRKSGMSGWFYRVLQVGINGTILAGDNISLIYRQANPLSVNILQTALYGDDKENTTEEMLNTIINHEDLTFSENEYWRTDSIELLEERKKEKSLNNF